MIRWIRNLSRSVFTRLILVILATGLLINLVVFLSFAHFRHRDVPAYHRILEHYIDTLAAAIGDPPSLQRARSIADATGLIISYQAPGQSWNTGAASLPASLERYHIRQVSGHTALGFYRGNILIRRSLASGQLFFAVPRSEAAERVLRRLMTVILTALTAILAVAYLTLRRILKPLRRMRHGVEAVHAGNFEHRVQPAGAVEFRTLATAFNAMTVRVQNMLKSKERLLLDVSHELRSPITRMKLALAMLPEDSRMASMREDLQEIEAMVNSLLEAARLQHTSDALEKAPFSLRSLVEEAIEPLRTRAPGVRIADSADVTITADPERLRMVIRNIVDNGVKYSLPDSPPVTLSWEMEGGIVRAVVQDQGIGIPANDLAHVFEPFYRVDDSRSRTTGGFGLGLSLAKTIVEAHGGTIAIKSSPQQGTRVVIALNKE